MNPSFEVLPRDLSPYRVGNVGVDYVHRFDSGQPGPHVLVNALTHGNEFCGMVAACHLLDQGVRPRVGTLTVSFANVEAYQSFDVSRPFDSRQLVDSPELRRARALRPVVDAADHVLDLHSTSQPVQPFWVYAKSDRNGAVALAIGRPAVHLVMPQGLGSGTPMIQHGRLGSLEGSGVGLVAECGQHFLRASADLATEVALDFLAYFGLVERAAPSPAPQRRFELLQTCMVTHDDFRFARPAIGFETFAKGELIASQGADEIRAPCDDCTILMPTREPIIGREAVYLSRAVG